MVLKLLEKDRRKRYQDAHHLHEELKSLQRSLPATPWEVGGAGRRRRASARAAAAVAGVIEWANRAALFSRMVSRAYPQGNAPAEIQSAVSQAWDLASRATRLEGEVASHTRKLEALERRGRALRAEIGRKVEELAHEESRALREPRAEQRRSSRLREAVRFEPTRRCTGQAGRRPGERCRRPHRVVSSRSQAPRAPCSRRGASN